MPQVNKKGFTLMEMIAVIFIVSLLNLLSLQQAQFNNPIRFKEFEELYKLKQLTALTTKKTMEFEHQFESNVPKLTFNQFGHVNMPQTITFGTKYFIVQLGMGRYVIK